MNNEIENKKMNRDEERRNSRRRKTGRSLLLLVLTLITVLTDFFGCFDPSRSYAIDYGNNSSAYHWTKIDSKEELDKYLVEYSNSKDLASITNTYKDETGWTRFMLVWKSGDSWYYTGTNKGDEKWDGSLVLNNYGIEPGEEEFETRTALDAPFMKPCTENSRFTCTTRYYEEGAFTGKTSVVIRFCNPGTDELSDTILQNQISYYGIKFKAAMYAEFALYGTIDNQYAGKGKHTAACNYYRNPSVGICWKYGKLFFNLGTYDQNGKSDSDRFWKISGSSIELVKDGYYLSESKMKSNYTDAYFYLGKKITLPKYDKTQVLEPGITHLMDNTTISEGTVIVVEEGSTLIVDGYVLNNGVILIRGGTLIVRGILDTDINDESDSSVVSYCNEVNKEILGGSSSDPSGYVNVSPDDGSNFNITNGSILCYSYGTILVEEGGAILQRNGYQFIELLFGSSMQVDGTVCTGTLFEYAHCQVTVNPGALLLCGAKIKDTADLDRVDTDEIYSYRSSDLTPVFHVIWPSIANDSTRKVILFQNIYALTGTRDYEDCASSDATLYLIWGSSLESEGLVYILYNDTTASPRYYRSSDCSFRGTYITDMYNTIDDGMVRWLLKQTD